MECAREGMRMVVRHVLYLKVTCPPRVMKTPRGPNNSEICMLVSYRVRMPRFLSHDSLKLMPCIKSGIKDHVFMQSIQDVDMQYPERPPSRTSRLPRRRWKILV